MQVTPWKIVVRGLQHRCPNCGGATLFARWTRWLTVNERCRACGLAFEREEGFFLGAMVINYTVTGLPLVPLCVAVVMGVLGVAAAVIAISVWCILFPVLFFRTSKSLWLMTYYLALPRELPANRPDAVGS